MGRRPLTAAEEVEAEERKAATEARKHARELAQLHIIMDRLRDLTDYQDGDDSSSRRRIITYAVTAKEITVPAYNEDTEMPNLQTAKWELCGPMMTPLSQYYEAEKIFWDQNIVFVRGLEHVSKDLTVRYTGHVKKLWMNVGVEKAEMKPGELKREIMRALKNCEALEMLVVAVVCKSANAVKRVTNKDLQTFAGAVRTMPYARKLILLCSEEMHVERREDLRMGLRSQAKSGGVAFAV